MALCEMHFASPSALKKQTSFMAIVPEWKQGPFPVLYLLHGLSDDHTIWARRTSIERYVQDLPLIVVMPNVDRSWYTDSAACPTARYETYIAEELIPFVDSTFPTIRSREGRATAGNSMGGYGAFKLALKHPDLFCAAVSFSGALVFMDWADLESEWVRELSLIFGESRCDGEEDLLSITRAADRLTVPSLYMDCGAEDFLIEANRQMHSHLDSLGIAHEYHEAPGGHTWDYWDAHFSQALTFLRNELRIP